MVDVTSPCLPKKGRGRELLSYGKSKEQKSNETDSYGKMESRMVEVNTSLPMKIDTKVSLEQRRDMAWALWTMPMVINTMGQWIMASQFPSEAKKRYMVGEAGRKD